jgi:hypothetical protein
MCDDDKEQGYTYLAVGPRRQSIPGFQVRKLGLFRIHPNYDHHLTLERGTALSPVGNQVNPAGHLPLHVRYTPGNALPVLSIRLHQEIRQ